MACLALGGTAQAQAPAEREAARFPVLEFQVSGNTTLPPLAVERAVSPFLGTGKTAADVEAAARALEAAYAEAGYRTVSVAVPQQNVDSGVLRLEVAEASVGRLRVTGARYFLPSRVREQAPSLAEGKVPQFGEVERDIITLNRLPDRRVVPDLRAGAAPGTVDVDLKVEDTFPLHGSVELNNQQTRNTKELRQINSISYANLFQRGDTVNLAYQFAPQRPSDVSVISGSYTYRLANGASLLGTFIRSDSDVATVGGTTVIGRGSVIGARGILPLPPSEGFSHTVTAGVDRKSFREGIVFGDRNDFPIEYYPFSATYLASWTTPRADTDVQASLTWAFRGLGSDDFEFTQRRANASPSFAHFRAEGSHLRRLANGMQLFGRVEGQAARDPLVSNEQFALGGVGSVRGYFEVEALGDYGIASQIEVRSPTLAPLLRTSRVNELRVHGFVDGGTAGIWRPTPGQQRNFNLISAGLGARTKVFDYLNGSVEGAALIIDGADRQAGEFRTLFRLWGEF